MKIKIALTAVLSVSLLALSGCSSANTTNTNTSTNTTANKTASSSPAANSNAANSNASKPGASKPTDPVKNEEKPKDRTAKDVPKKVPVPQNWVYTYDDQKGYGFQVPQGTTADYKTINGVNFYEAWTPDPADVWVLVAAWKDKTLSKDDLVANAKGALESYGENVTVGPLQSLSDDYGLAEASSTDSDGKKWKYKILVGTDVTDNYVMIVGAEEAKYEANKDVLDAIWGSFEIWSGGASGKS